MSMAHRREFFISLLLYFGFIFFVTAAFLVKIDHSSCMTSSTIVVALDFATTKRMYESELKLNECIMCATGVCIRCLIDH
jgi:hypothetical protein